MAFHTSALVLFILHIAINAVVVSPMLKTADSEAGTNLASLTDRCRIRRIVHRIEHPGCVSKRLLSFACRGGCESYSQYSDAIAGIERYCSCCQPSGEVLRKVICRFSVTDKAKIFTDRKCTKWDNVNMSMFQVMTNIEIILVWLL